MTLFRRYLSVPRMYALINITQLMKTAGQQQFRTTPMSNHICGNTCIHAHTRLLTN